jgi:hypothetical protein
VIVLLMPEGLFGRIALWLERVAPRVARRRGEVAP